VRPPGARLALGPRRRDLLLLLALLPRRRRRHADAAGLERRVRGVWRRRHRAQAQALMPPGERVRRVDRRVAALAQEGVVGRAVPPRAPPQAAVAGARGLATHGAGAGRRVLRAAHVRAADKLSTVQLAAIPGKLAES